MNRINNYYLYYYSIGNNFIQQARNIILTLCNNNRIVAKIKSTITVLM